MMQLYCPACENVVWVEDNDEEVVPCPECQQPINWLGQHRQRSSTETTLPAGQERERDTHIATAAAHLEEETNWRSEASSVAEGSWNDAAAQDFSLPCPAPPPRFVGLPYRPDGGVSLFRLPLFLAGVLIAGVALGVIASMIGEICYLVLLYPLAVGFVLAGLTILAARLAHVRSPLLAGVAGMMGACLCVLAMHWLDYHRTLILAQSDPTRLPSELAGRLLASTGLLDYFDAMASLGLTISGRNTGGLHLGYVATHLYWLCELLLVTLLAAAGGASGARDPFCVFCRVWKEERFLGTLRDGGEAMLRDLKRGNLSALECCRPSPVGQELVLRVTVCPRCGLDCPIDLRIERHSRARKAPVSRAWPMHLTLPGEALRVLETTFAC
jgi:hypothetical protein